MRLSPIEQAASPYLFDLITWEVTHLPDKWLYKLWSKMPWNSVSREARLENLERYFRMEREIRSLEQELVELRARSGLSRPQDRSADRASHSREVEDLLVRLAELRQEQSKSKPGVEETLESEVSAILAREGLNSRIGLIFPPIDIALASPPMVLVVSPRDRIERRKTVLLDPGMNTEDMDALESKIFAEQNLAALVEGIGGLATYPTMVHGRSSLRRAAILTAHEWLHAYWIFRPLGWNFWSSPEMTTLNETAATVAGEELGILAYEAITGEKVEQPGASSNGEAQTIEEIDELEGGFDFNAEMRETRLRTDELLGEGKVEEAEAYMEERRLLFVENGFHIRKLNQAFFAFRGTYATSPASVSPIGGQVEELRAASASVGDFIRTVSGFGSYQEFLEHLYGLRDRDAGAPTTGAVPPIAIGRPTAPIPALHPRGAPE